MGIVKAVAPKNGANLKGLKASLNYIFRQDKSLKVYRAVTGPFEGEIKASTVYHAFVDEQEKWQKTGGRTYSHYVLSWHRDEPITPEQALEIGKAFAEDYFAGHQTAIAIHTDKNHLHCHLVANSVSFLDGKKLHLTRKDLDYARNLNDALCLEHGLSITRTGYDFYGNKKERGKISSYSTAQYQMIKNKQEESYVSNCYHAVSEALKMSKSKEEFIQKMNDQNWKVSWSDGKKHITFEDEEGHKVRAARLGKLFHEDFSKAGLEKQLKENAEQTLSEEVFFEEEPADTIGTVMEGTTTLLGTVRTVTQELRKKERRKGRHI